MGGIVYDPDHYDDRDKLMRIISGDLEMMKKEWDDIEIRMEVTG